MTNYKNNLIDLTDDSFTITAHCFMGKGTVIELDDTTNGDNYRPTPQIKKAKAKRYAISKKTNQMRSPKKVEKPKKKKKTCGGIGNCPICLDKLGTSPIACTKCGHVYCMKCLEQCLRRVKRCPTCRRELKGSSAYHPIYLSTSNHNLNTI